ncbi:glycosyl hydrolase family 61-domain-containing protein [Aspergillus cavernicola]|uniref:AA9 family lytic polysaccharide monooxygenase n=1 Tax=Aspergillus cavernicola TaxID=176166 RepID=A0ABR4I7D9_9EURO
MATTTARIFAANVGSQDFASQTEVYQVKAGDEIGFGTDFNTLIQHPGSPPGVYEPGPKSFGSDGIEWGATDIGNFTFPLPKETPAGQYLVRIEHIALHGAGDYADAEMYFNCAQIEVEGDSAAVPEPVVKIPGVYTGYEPGILFYMYRPYWTNYTMPGPKVWPNGGDSVIYADGVSVAPDDAWSAPAVIPSSVSTTAIATASSSPSSSYYSSYSSITSSASSVLPSPSVATSAGPTESPVTTAAPVPCDEETVTATASVTETITVDPACKPPVTVTVSSTTTVTVV